MKKSDCTKDEWDAYLKYHRERRAANLSDEQEKRREYNSRPDVKARRKTLDSHPEAIERRRLRTTTPEAKKLDSMRRRLHRELFPETHAARLSQQRHRRTNISPELFSHLLKLQRNRCAICEREFGGKTKPCGDHCHETGIPRGILCHKCNAIEGLIKSIGLSPESFCGRLSDYLTTPPTSLIQVKQP